MRLGLLALELYHKSKVVDFHLILLPLFTSFHGKAKRLDFPDELLTRDPYVRPPPTLRDKTLLVLVGARELAKPLQVAIARLRRWYDRWH